MSRRRVTSASFSTDSPNPFIFLTPTCYSSPNKITLLIGVNQLISVRRSRRVAFSLLTGQKVSEPTSFPLNAWITKNGGVERKRVVKLNIGLCTDLDSLLRRSQQEGRRSSVCGSHRGAKWSAVQATITLLSPAILCNQHTSASHSVLRRSADLIYKSLLHHKQRRQDRTCYMLHYRERFHY